MLRLFCPQVNEEMQWFCVEDPVSMAVEPVGLETRGGMLRKKSVAGAEVIPSTGSRQALSEHPTQMEARSGTTLPPFGIAPECSKDLDLFDRPLKRFRQSLKSSLAQTPG
jgi:hypothetical protein